MAGDLDGLLGEIGRCQVCAAHLPHGPRPVVQLARGARILIIGQAPGSKVHASGIPWEDDSGLRLRAWTGLDDEAFYDPERVAMMPMGFCYPGTGGGADLPPRPECAPLWHHRVLAALPDIRLTLLIGIHAQARYLPGRGRATMTEAVRDFRAHLPARLPLPHPSWRSVGWMRRNPWFETEVLPELRLAVTDALAPVGGPASSR